MRQANTTIRTALRVSDIRQWELAAALGIAPETLCRKLRTQLSAADEAKMLSLIDDLAADKEKI